MTRTLFTENTMSSILEQDTSIEDNELENWKEQLEAVLMVCSCLIINSCATSLTESCFSRAFMTIKCQSIIQSVQSELPMSFLKRVGSLIQRRKRSASSASYCS